MTKILIVVDEPILPAAAGRLVRKLFSAEHLLGAVGCGRAIGGRGSLVMPDGEHE